MIWLNLQPLSRLFTSQNNNFSSYPHSNELNQIFTFQTILFAQQRSAAGNMHRLIEKALRNDVVFPTVNHRTCCCKFFTLSNQTWHYINKCIRILIDTKEARHEKTCLCYMRLAQISLCIHAV